VTVNSALPETSTNPRARRPLILAAAFLLAASCTSASVHAQLTTWDTFSGRVLNTNKWKDGWFSANALELKKNLVRGTLELGVTGMGDISLDGGVTRARNRIVFPDRLNGKIQSVETRMWVTQGRATYCPRAASEDRSRGRLRHIITWFNDGSSSGPEDQTGNVASYLSLRVAPGDPRPQVRIWVWKCTDESCSTSIDGAVADNFLMNVAFNQPVTMTTTYRASNNSLLFTAKAGARTVRRVVPLGSLGRARGIPVVPFNAIEARAEADNCRLGPDGHSSPRRPIASIEGRVDLVRLRLSP